MNKDNKRYKVLFVNQFDLFMNNSAGITVRNLFSDDYCRKMPRITIIKNVVKYQNNNIEKNFSFNFIYWNKIINCLDKDNVDIVYTTASASKILLFLLYIKIMIKIPILIHYFDNWRETGSIKTKNFILKLIGWPNERALVISDEMKKYYHNKYRGNYTTLMVGTINRKKSNTIKSNKIIKIMYAGGLHLGRVDSLTDIEEIINNEFKDVELIIATFKKGYGYDMYHNKFNKNKTKFLIDIKHEEIEKYYSTVDALLFVENAPKENLNYLKYSMSTKIPEYLSSGLPIICYAKPDIACYEYFKRTKSALLATTKEEVIQAIEKIRTKNWGNIIKNAQIAARHDFDHLNQNNTLNNIIQEMINKNT